MLSMLMINLEHEANDIFLCYFQSTAIGKKIKENSETNYTHGENIALKVTEAENMI